MTHDEIVRRVCEALAEMFQLSPSIVTMDARLVEDLDLDSIDAIDMAARIQEFAGGRLAESDMRRIRTVGDVVDVVERMVQAGPDSSR